MGDNSNDSTESVKLLVEPSQFHAHVLAAASLSLTELFPFPLDGFQLEAIEHLQNGCSVVVCAPTGSGKTVIAEYTVHHAVAQGKRVFYTTPLKALSNQKYHDLCEVFGVEAVGLLTGDISVNHDATVVVMTTEIFRNMLYGIPLGEMGTTLQNVQAVILDECHYMNDSQRGTVWEEAIIYCPNEIQLVALSATIANSGQLTDWINRTHGPTKLVYSDFRPVPLRHHFFAKGLVPLLNEQKTSLHPALRPIKKTGNRVETPDPRLVVSSLANREMLPAIYFIFSRRGCDEALKKSSGLSLVNEEEKRRLKVIIDEFCRTQPDAVRSNHLEALYNGIAVHHAGVLPLWKMLVEQLFQQGLIKVVFATETLAAGINMPARTTVIGMLSKRTDTGHRQLNPSEFLQMAGRAGRRGMDKVGHVVLLPSPFEAAYDAARLALAESDPLVSQFTASYGMVLNLLERHNLVTTRTLIERSFGQYLSTLHLAPFYEEEKLLQQELQQLNQQQPPITADDLESYEKLNQDLRQARRELKNLDKKQSQTPPVLLPKPLGKLIYGRLLTVSHPRTQQIQTAIFIEEIPFDEPLYVCLNQDNQWLLLDRKHILVSHDQKVSLPRGLFAPSRLTMQVGSTLKGDDQTLIITEQLPILDGAIPAAVMISHQETVYYLEKELVAHPAHQVHRRTWEKHFERYQKIERRLEYIQKQFAQQGQYYWLEFLKLVNVLTQAGFVEDASPTKKGHVAAVLRGDNELWLGLALLSGELDHLTPPQLAACCCALVSEPPRPQSWVTMLPSTAVEEAVEGLRHVRRDLLKRQRQQEVFLPCWLEVKLCGLVEQWAGGASWEELGRMSNLDEGDLVRLLRRTLDFLRQIPYAPSLSPLLKQTATQAQVLVDRFPIHEVV